MQLQRDRYLCVYLKNLRTSEIMKCRLWRPSILQRNFYADFLYRRIGFRTLKINAHLGLLEYLTSGMICFKIHFYFHYIQVYDVLYSLLLLLWWLVCLLCPCWINSENLLSHKRETTTFLSSNNTCISYLCVWLAVYYLPRIRIISWCSMYRFLQISNSTHNLLRIQTIVKKSNRFLGCTNKIWNF